MAEQREPLYKIIERDLRQAILSGELKQNEMIPSEYELCAKYGCTRMTVRQAINNLLVDGYIYRHKGRGTFVIFNKKEMDQNAQVSFFSFAREMIGGDQPLISKVIDLKLEEADENIAIKLQLGSNKTVYYVERVRKSNGVALVYERMYLPIELYPELNSSCFENSFHDYIQKELGFVIKNQQTAIEARALAPRVAEILNCSEGEPVLYMSSVTYLENGKPCIYNRQYFLGTHFRFKHNFTKEK